jgi:hypothetical protein
MATAACGASGSGGDAAGTAGGGTADSGSSSADATVATSEGSACDVGACSGTVVVAVDGGPTFSDVGFERTACLVVEQGGLVIELQRQETCDGASIALVATFRIPERVDAAGFWELGVAETAASWSIQNADAGTSGVYLPIDNLILSLSEYDPVSGGRVAGNLAAPIDGASPLTATGQGSAMFDITIE